jgi:hypothetical protein
VCVGASRGHMQARTAVRRRLSLLVRRRLSLLGSVEPGRAVPPPLRKPVAPDLEHINIRYSCYAANIFHVFPVPCLQTPRRPCARAPPPPPGPQTRPCPGAPARHCTAWHALIVHTDQAPRAAWPRPMMGAAVFCSPRGALCRRPSLAWNRSVLQWPGAHILPPPATPTMLRYQNPSEYFACTALHMRNASCTQSATLVVVVCALAPGNAPQPGSSINPLWTGFLLHQELPAAGLAQSGAAAVVHPAI